MSSYTKLKFQIILFGDFSSIDTTSENITKLMEIVTPYQMLPNTFKEIEIEVNGQQIKNDRIGFSNMKSGFNIMLGTKRIDIINHIVGFDDNNMYEIDTFIDNTKLIINKISEKFPSIQCYNRLSFICEFFTNKNNNEKESIYKALIKNISDNIPIDWSLRQNNIINIDNLGQDINCVSFIERVQGKFILEEKEKEVDEIKIQYDFNTKLEILNKFNNNQLDIFLDESLQLYKDNNKRIEEIFNAN